jgi:hypothetical protein
VLGPDFFASDINQPSVLLHELLHITLKMNDDELEQYLTEKFGYKNKDPWGTDDISEWLRKDCPD